MPTTQKKTSARRATTVRDITVKKVKQDEDAFQVHRINEESPQNAVPARSLAEPQEFQNEVKDIEEEVEEALAEMDDVKYDSKPPVEDVEPRDFVRVKFAKFVQLVSTRDCADVVNANLDEDVVMSSNLLTELAGTHDEREEKKIPLVFLVGLAIGVVLTYILIMK